MYTGGATYGEPKEFSFVVVVHSRVSLHKLDTLDSVEALKWLNFGFFIASNVWAYILSQ